MPVLVLATCFSVPPRETEGHPGANGLGFDQGITSRQGGCCEGLPQRAIHCGPSIPYSHPAWLRIVPTQARSLRLRVCVPGETLIPPRLQPLRGARRGSQCRGLLCADQPPHGSRSFQLTHSRGCCGWFTRFPPRVHRPLVTRPSRTRAMSRDFTLSLAMCFKEESPNETNLPGLHHFPRSRFEVLTAPWLTRQCRGAGGLFL